MEYLIGVGFLALVWAAFFIYRPDLQKAMVWSGLLYVFVMSAAYLVFTFLWPELPSENTVVPGYWYPDTLFDLGRRTGYAIEDALYGFFTAGLAVSVYEYFFRKHIGHRHAKHRPHIAISVAGFAGFATATLNLNLIWALIAFGFAGAATIWLQRPDLVRHSLYGGLSYLAVYTGVFLFFLWVFPDYVETTYSLQNLSGILFLEVPLEEYIFAVSFGLMWSPIYEYMRDLR